MTNFDNASIRELEWNSIRDFVENCSPYISGAVLDFGAGKMPYADIIRAHATYYDPYDRTSHLSSVATHDLGPENPFCFSYDTILCTQVVQYIEDVPALLELFHTSLVRRAGHLILTYPTNWDEVEPWDWHRFTKAGMKRLLSVAGFQIIQHTRRASIVLNDFTFALGYGVLARA